MSSKFEKRREKIAKMGHKRDRDVTSILLDELSRRPFSLPPAY